jgi:hypothetical protein
MSAPRWPASGRFLVVLLIMLDTLRRMLLGDQLRPIDVSMLIVELLVLLLILAEFIWKIAERVGESRKRKRHQQEILVRVATLKTRSRYSLKIPCFARPAVV